MADKGSSISVFDNEIFIKGDIISNGNIDICGRIEGNIISNTLNVKSGGVVVGKLFANEVCLTNNGIVNGDIVANKIHLSKESKINGNLFYNIISIEDGAILEGTCNKLTEEQIMEQINNNRSNYSSTKEIQE